MKKLLAILLAAMMLLSFVACGESQETETDVNNENNENNENTENNGADTPAVDDQPPVVEEGVILPTVGEDTWGYALWSAFLASAQANPEATAFDHVLSILNTDAGKALGGFVETAEVPGGFLWGFAEEIHGFNNGAVYTASAGFAFMSYVFVLDEGADVNAFIAELDAKKDMRWMICMPAEQFTVGAYKNIVFCSMAPVVMPGTMAGEATIFEPDFAEGSLTEELWNFFCQAMDENPMGNAEEMAYALAYSPVIPFDLCEVTAVPMGDVADFKYTLDGGFEQAFCVKPSGVESNFAIYIFTLEMGIMVDSWMDYYAASAQGEQVAYGAYNNNVVVFINTEVAE